MIGSTNCNAVIATAILVLFACVHNVESIIKLPSLSKFKNVFRWQAATMNVPPKVTNPINPSNFGGGGGGFVPKAEREALDVRIDDTWYDLSIWRKAHPSGQHWIDMYKNRDATEVMQAFHSNAGLNMLQRLPKTKPDVVEQLDATTPPVSEISRNFRILRQQLIEDGWFKRDYWHEARLFAIWAGLAFSGLAYAKSIPLLGMVLLALANTAAGWIGHDYIHGVDKFSNVMRNFACIAAGMSPLWWSDKHNKHHAVPNEMEVDEDIMTEPLLYVYPPKKSKDNALRPYQHLYVPLAFSLLFAIWRIDSLKVCLQDMKNGFKRKTQWELGLQLAHYAIMFTFVPFPVFIGQLLFAGLMTAVIVTVTHQSEDLFFEYNPDFVTSQFLSTRNAKTSSLFSDWLWGGMQWQLEHHLFPAMPRSKYPALSKVIQKFAAENNLEYRITDEFPLIKKNWDMYKRVAALPAIDDDQPTNTAALA